MSKHYSTDVWFPDDQHGYSIGICRCKQGPYLGARKSGTPCCCERCGFITQEQFDFLDRRAAARALREAAAAIDPTITTGRYPEESAALHEREIVAESLRDRADEIEAQP